MKFSICIDTYYVIPKVYKYGCEKKACIHENSLRYNNNGSFSLQFAEPIDRKKKLRGTNKIG